MNSWMGHKKVRGIILAGGYGTRMYPITKGLNKHLLPVYDKPMVYYPLTTLIKAGVREILIITHPPQLPLYENILEDGSQWGVQITYKTQPKSVNVAANFLLAAEFIENNPVCLILGDNIFYGDSLFKLCCQAQASLPLATVFTYQVEKPQQYGVVEFNDQHQPVKLVEKPAHTASCDAVTGLYFYAGDVVDIVQAIPPESRATFNITDLNQIFLDKKRLNIIPLPQDVIWFDAGTHDALLTAANFVYVLEHRANIMIGCPEEAAWRLGYIETKQLKQLAIKHRHSLYGEYLNNLLVAHI